MEAGRAPRAEGPTTALRCSTRRPLDAVQAVHRKPSLARDSQGTRAHCRCPPKGSSQGLGMGTDWVLCWDRVHQMRAKAQGGSTGAACRGRSRWMAGGWASRPGRVVCEPSVAAGTTDDQDKGRKDGRETKLSISQWKRAQGLYTGQERTHVRRQIGLQSVRARCDEGVLEVWRRAVVALEVRAKVCRQRRHGRRADLLARRWVVVGLKWPWRHWRSRHMAALGRVEGR